MGVLNFVILAAVLAIASAIFLAVKNSILSPGHERMQEISKAIH